MFPTLTKLYILAIILHVVAFNVAMLFLVRPTFIFKTKKERRSKDICFYALVLITALILGSFAYIMSNLNRHVL